MALGELLGGVDIGTGGVGGFVNLITIIALVFIALVVIAGIVWFFYNKKRWNIKRVTFRLPREIKKLGDGNTPNLNNIRGVVDKEFGKGCFDSKRGVVFLKRKGKKKIPMKPFEINEYLDANGDLEVMQVGANDYVPIIPKSYMIYTDSNNNSCAFVNLRADTSDSKSWKESFERQAKNAYSVMSLLERYATAISIGLVIFLWGIQLLLLYNRLKS